MNFLLKCFFTSLLPLCSCAQNITTVAGNGSGDTLGNGGPAISAAVGNVGLISFDDSNNYYFNEFPDWIRKISYDGIISIIAGNGTTGFEGDDSAATTASLNLPAPQYYQGNLYIADQSNNRIRKVDLSTGIISTIVGTGIAGFSGDGGLADTAELNSPASVAFDSYGNMYISDGNNNRIRKVDTLGFITTIAGNGSTGYEGDGGLATNAELWVGCISIDTWNNLYIGSYEKIRRINLATNIIITVAGNGTVGYSGDGGLADSAEIWFAECVIPDNQGNFYISDDYNNVIRKVDTAGIIHTFAGNNIGGFSGDGGPATAAELNSPRGLALDLCGNLYIADNGNGRIRKITFSDTPAISVTGTSTVTAGNSVTLSASVSSSGTYTIHWYDNGTLVATTATPSFTYTMSGTADTITATIISAGGCYDSITSAPHIVTVNDNSVQQMSASSILIYPNPAHDQLTITGPAQQVQVSNAVGQVLLTLQCNSYKTVVDISTFPAGMYLLTIKAADNSKATSKIIKE